MFIANIWLQALCDPLSVHYSNTYNNSTNKYPQMYVNQFKHTVYSDMFRPTMAIFNDVKHKG